MNPTTTSNLLHASSKDGTDIAIERTGDGPPVILVCGGSVDRWSNAGLAAQLAPRFSAWNYDRRGRGDSGDMQPYAIDREIEDIEAVLKAAGGSAFLYGSSSGAALALLAAARLKGITKLALWEPPYIMDPAARPPADQVQQYELMIAEGRRGDAAEYFMAKVVRMPPEFVAQARSMPWWPAQEALAHTLAYDARVMGDYSLPKKAASSVTIPTLVLTGGASFPFMHETARALVDVLPKGQHRLLEGQEHNVSPEVLGPALIDFFA
ncbi:MAG: alpha/beta hydrolase [Chloroflexota bacterium]|nr:alpha/beta hydrolase [Chloroflexota bacterium]